MTETAFSLTFEEREFLTRILQNALKNARVEEHRTRTPSYREHVIHDEELIASLLEKLGHPSA